MRTTKVLIGISSLGIAVTVPALGIAAEGLDYTYLQLEAVGRDVDSFDQDEGIIEDFDDGGGWALRGSWAFVPRYFVFGNYSNTESDVSYFGQETLPLPADTDIKRFDVGFGTNREINERVDFVGRIAYTDIDYGDFDIGGSGDLINGGLDNLTDELRADESDGYFADAGVRSQLTPNIEGTIGLRYTSVESIDSTSVIGSLLFELTETWGIDLNVDAGDDISTYSLGVRFIPQG